MRNQPSVKTAIYRVIKQEWKLSLLLLAVVLGVVAVSLAPPQLLRRIIDQHLTSGVREGLLGLAFTYLGVFLLIGLLEFAKEGLLVLLGQRITVEIRLEMMEKLQRLHSRYFSDHQAGTVVSRFTNDVETINSLFTNGIVGMVVDCFKVVGILFSIWYFSPRLGWVTLALVPLIVLITRMFQKRMLVVQIENRKQVAKVNNHISETLNNVRMIKSFHKELYMEDRYREDLTENVRTVERVNFYDSCYAPVIQLLRAMLISAVVLLTAPQVGWLGISLGMVAASIELISNLFAPIESLGMELQSIQGAISGIRRVEDFFAEEEERPKEEMDLADLLPDRTSVTLAFKDLCFSYAAPTEEHTPPVLEHISLMVHTGEKVTFAGRTGVGKSTLFKLILGLLEPSSGSITLNGHPMHLLPNSLKRQLFGYVDQDFRLIKGTVADQVSLRDPTITREQVEEAMKFVGLHETVLRLPEGYDTPLVQDTLFSQGQKQLLNIARAIVADPPILLLDEMTANLDSITEEHILSVLQRAGEQRTILSISHRLSSLDEQDRLVLLEHGMVRATGTLAELREQDVWFRSSLQLEQLTWQ